MTPLFAQRPRMERAFERLYRRHVADVYRYALAVLHNPADAEDATQTTFLSAYRAFQRGERPEKPQNWLIKIAHNVCRQRFREAARRPHEVELVLEPAAAPPPDDDIPTADEIRTALSHLSFNQRAALVMRELEGRSYAEIAQILEISVGAVETLLFRGRRALREQLEGSLTCGEAEHALAARLEGRLSADGKRSLRAHVRACAECRTLERRQRAHRAALRSLGTVPIPASLETFGGAGWAAGGGGGVVFGGGGGVAAKVAAVVAAGVVAGAAGQQAVQAFDGRSPEPDPRFQPAHVNAPAPSPVQQPGATAASSATSPTPAADAAVVPTKSDLADRHGRMRHDLDGDVAPGHAPARPAPAQPAPATQAPAAAQVPAPPASLPPPPSVLPNLPLNPGNVVPPPPAVEAPALPPVPQLPPAPPVPQLPPAPPVPQLPPVPPVPEVPPVPPLP